MSGVVEGGSVGSEVVEAAVVVVAGVVVTMQDGGVQLGPTIQKGILLGKSRSF